MSIQSTLLLGLTLLLVSFRALALDGSIRVGAELEHTDNALKTDENTRSELEQRVTALVAANHSGEDLVADISYDFSYTDYDKDTQNDETVIVGDASIVYEQIEQQLFWSLENSRRNLRADKQDVDIEANREDRSITRFGPQFIFRPSSVDSVNTRLSYALIEYEDSDEQDSERLGASASWVRSLSKIDALSLSFNFEDVTFDRSEDDYEYYLATLGYEAALSKLNYKIVVGYNESKRDTGNVDGGYFRGEAEYTSGRSEWSANLLHELTDSSRQDNNGNLTGLGDSGNFGGEVDVFERSTAELEYENSGVCSACTVRTSLYYESEDYESIENDSDELGLRLNFGYRYTPRTTLNAGLRYADLAFKGGNLREDYDYIEARLGLDQRFTREFTVSFGVELLERDSDAVAGDYEELRGGIRAVYLFD